MLSVSGWGCPNWCVKCLRAFSLSVGVSNASFMMSSIIFSVLSDSVKMSLNHVSVCFLRFHQWSFMVEAVLLSAQYYLGL